MPSINSYLGTMVPPTRMLNCERKFLAKGMQKDRIALESLIQLKSCLKFLNKYNAKIHIPCSLIVLIVIFIELFFSDDCSGSKCLSIVINQGFRTVHWSITWSKYSRISFKWAMVGTDFALLSTPSSGQYIRIRWSLISQRRKYIMPSTRIRTQSPTTMNTAMDWSDLTMKGFAVEDIVVENTLISVR